MHRRQWCSPTLIGASVVLDEVHAQLVGNETAALADVVISTRAATRRAFGTVPVLTEPWKVPADELTQTFE